MIQVVIKKTHQQIKDVEVSGHANSAEYGKDLVCASVSLACIGIANALEERHFTSHHFGTINVREGYVRIKIDKVEKDIQVVLETFEVLLKTIEESYTQYIQIKEMEV